MYRRPRPLHGAETRGRAEVGRGASPVRTELYFLQLGTLIAHREAAIAPSDAEGVSYLYG